MRTRGQRERTGRGWGGWEGACDQEEGGTSQEEVNVRRLRQWHSLFLTLLLVFLSGLAVFFPFAIFSSFRIHRSSLLSSFTFLSPLLSLFSPTIFRCYSWRETFWERIKTLIYSAIDHGRAKLYRSINNRKIIPREARLALSFVDSTCNRIIDTVRWALISWRKHSSACSYVATTRLSAKT